MNDEDILSLKGIGHQALDQIRSVFVYSRNQTLSQSLRKQSIAKVPELVDENVVEPSALEVNPSFDLTEILPFASYPAIADYFSNHLTQRQIHALLTEVAKPRLEYFLRRCSGETLQNIGESQGITRERVRQHCVKVEKKTGIKPQDVVKFLEQADSDANEKDIFLAFEKDLSQTLAIGDNVNDAWLDIHKREPTLADRINLFEKYCVPITLSELNLHIDLIEKSVGSYGGEAYWKESTVRSLIWCMSIRLGKTGIMPKQVELPRLLSRYIQKSFGGQKKAAEIFGLQYIGPAGTRNRSYWTQERISEAIVNTQNYFCIPAELIPEQSQLNYYLEVDDDDETRGASCLAAIKRICSWEEFASQANLLIFTDLLPEQKVDIEKKIAVNFWNENIPFNSKSHFLDCANSFMNTFWRSPTEPLRYNGVMAQMRSISRLISDNKIDLSSSMTIQLLSPNSGRDGGDVLSDNEVIDEIMDILF